MHWMAVIPSPSPSPVPLPTTSQALLKLLPYGLGIVLILGVILWLTQQFIGRFLQDLASRSTSRFVTTVSASRTLSIRAHRRYKKAVARNYASHPLGFVEGAVIDIRDIYVPLQSDVDNERVDVYRLIRGESRVVVVGAPGAGKSLLLKNSMLIWADTPSRSRRYIPVFVDLYRCNGNELSLEELITQELNRNSLRRAPSFTEKALQDGALRVLFDGLDEVARDDQHRVSGMLRDFVRKHSKIQTVVTCRDAVYYGQLAPDFTRVIRVADFDDASIRRFLKMWPKLESGDVERLMGDLNSNPEMMKLAASPLLLTMIAYLHTEVFLKSGRSLPTSRAAFYDIAIDHLVRRDRDLSRHKSISVYDAGDKKAVLQRVAFALQTAPAERLDRRSIAHVELLSITKALLPDLNLDDTHAKPLLEEIVDRSQLLVRLDRLNSRYAFRHLTLQEYLAAVELATDPEALVLHYYDDRGAWRETVKLWCGASGRDATTLVRELFTNADQRDKLLALECLAEAKRIDDALATLVVDHFLASLRDPSPPPAVITALGSVTADARPRGRRVLDRLAGLAYRGNVPAMQAIAASRLPAGATILAEIAGESAYDALRAMGDQAVPGLGGAAANGSRIAVDRLADIATPAAAQALLDIAVADSAADDGGPLANRAAWHLAVLVADPETEAAMLERLPNPSTEFLLQTLAALLRRSTPADIPRLRMIDVRVGILAAVIPATHEMGSADDRAARIDLAETLSALDPGRFAGMGVNSGKGFWSRIRNALVESPWTTSHRRTDYQVTPRNADICKAVLSARGASEITGQVFARLPWIAQLAATYLVFARRKVRPLGSRDLQIASEQPEEPKRLSNLIQVLWTVLVVAVAAGAYVIAIGVLIGASEHLARWASWPLIALITLSLPLFVGSVVHAKESPRIRAAKAFGELTNSFMEKTVQWLDKKWEPLTYVYLVVLFLVPAFGALALDITVAVRTFGAGAVAVALLIIGLVMGSAHYALYRRGRAYNNPVLAIIAADESAVANRMSIISADNG